MPSWIPVPGTVTERLVRAGLELFGRHGFRAVGVSAIATAAGVTTGALYHHFGSKDGLYRLVKGDVEQRVLDRMIGAAGARQINGVGDLTPGLLTAFDYLVADDLVGLLIEPAEPDRIAELIAGQLGASAALGTLIAGTWRSALLLAMTDPPDARNALVSLLGGSPAGT